MSFYVLYRESDGRAISYSTLEPQSVTAGRAVKVFDNPPADNTQWEEATLTFIPIPPKVYVDRLLEMLTDSEYADDIQLVWNGLSAANRTRLRNGLIRLLGTKRFRRDTETLAIKD